MTSASERKGVIKKWEGMLDERDKEIGRGREG